MAREKIVHARLTDTELAQIEALKTHLTTPGNPATDTNVVRFLLATYWENADDDTREMAAAFRIEAMGFTVAEREFVFSDWPNRSEHIDWLLKANREEIADWISAGK